jgi:DNA invertase Pin-like site-specific DNA recombinase
MPHHLDYRGCREFEISVYSALANDRQTERNMSNRRRPVPAVPTFVAYYRVSTERQGRSGLGLDAQRETVTRYLAGQPVAAEFVEVESGRKADRPQLAQALALCRAIGASLVVAKLDRLSRDVDFLRQCVRDAGDSGVVFCDLPDLPPGAAGRLMLTVMASIAEFEAGRISERTAAALAQAKARGVKLGNPRLRAGDAEAARVARAARTEQAAAHAKAILPFITAARRAGAVSLREIAEAMEARGVRTPAGGTVWHASTVRRVEQSAVAPAERDCPRQLVAAE